MQNKQYTGWAMQEFSNISLGDKRLNNRLIKLCDKLSEAPESSINQACSTWADTKGAYRFFKNETVDAAAILKSHISKTVGRAEKYDTVLAIQDTSYLVYTSHKKTEGLGRISSVKHDRDKTPIVSTNGLIMHTSLAVSTEGLPLGILDQRIKARTSQVKGKNKNNQRIPIEDKESYRWLESLNNTKDNLRKKRVVTICDRESDIYEFFHLSSKINAPVLVRASVDRTLTENNIRLWSFMKTRPVSGVFNVETPARDGKPSRVATLQLHFSSFVLKPPQKKASPLPNLSMTAVYVVEKAPSSDKEKLEWMLLTNLSVNNYEEAFEKVRWYCLRWRIEMFHKVLKSGFRIESCRLESADRLIRYVTIMSIIAWRMFMITLISRSNPDLPCNIFLSEGEWKVLYLKIKQKNKFPKQIPKIKEVVKWVAQLGGFLARKGDGDPGTITLWRGWKRLTDLTEGWYLARQWNSTCG